MRAIVAACALAAAVLAVACGESLTLPRDTVGTSWRLQSLERADRSVITAPAATFTLRFADEFRLEVRADCNSCGGAYVFTPAVFEVGPLACTRVFCPTAPFDTEYVTLIESATAVEQDGDTLFLRSPAGVLRFVR